MDSFVHGSSPGRRPVSWPLIAGGLGVALAAALFVAGSLIASGGPAPGARSSPSAAAVAAADPAADRQAQASLRQARSAAAAAFLESSSWAGAGAGQLSVLDPSLTFVDGSTASTGPTIVSVAASSSGWAAASLSASGRCFYVHVGPGGRTSYGSGSPCTGDAETSASGSAW